jgi:hypothetical protein
MSAAGTVQECRSFYAQRLKFAEPERMALDPIVNEIRSTSNLQLQAIAKQIPGNVH